MLQPPSQPELMELLSRRQREREAEAAAERLRSRPIRRHTASFLYHLADRLSPDLAASPSRYAAK